MKIATQTTDAGILRELGLRLTGARLRLNLTQAELAEQAGVSKRTIERLESGETAMQLLSLLRVCRVLGLLERLDSLVPEDAPSPMEQLRLQGRTRQRATGKKTSDPEFGTWTWRVPK
ncbi:MAG: helix-turn-helix domain-containing protein [Candidatus Kapabacteria bacterium]|nr:helix-turn-helix domain-containing protein [Candidatus Kapabacteria bacterium]